MQAAVVTFDHLALSFLGCYGNTLLRTPRFDRFASASVVFDNCFAASDVGDAMPGLTEFIARLRERGDRVFVHECCAGEPLDHDARQRISGWQLAVAAGQPALLWLNSSAVASPWRAVVDRVLEIGRASMTAETLSEWLAAQSVDVTDDAAPPAAMLGTALEKLRAAGLLQRESIAPTREIGALRRLVYAAAVAEIDDWLGEVLDLLETARQPQTLRIVASARGDLTGPHAELSSGCPPLIDPLIHVPLLISTGTAADGTRRGALTSTADIAATLTETFGLEPHRATNDGRSLWSLLRDEASGVREELQIGSAATGWCRRTADYACICGPGTLLAEAGAWPETADQQPRLFVKPDDAWDTLDVAPQRPEVTMDMVQRIHAQVRDRPTDHT